MISQYHIQNMKRLVLKHICVGHGTVAHMCDMWHYMCICASSTKWGMSSLWNKSVTSVPSCWWTLNCCAIHIFRVGTQGDRKGKIGNSKIENTALYAGFSHKRSVTCYKMEVWFVGLVCRFLLRRSRLINGKELKFRGYISAISNYLYRGSFVRSLGRHFGGHHGM